MSDRSPKPGLVAPHEVLPPDTTEPLALVGEREHAVRRSLDTLARVETMLVLHYASPGSPAERRLRGIRPDLWVAQDLLREIVSGQPEEE